MFKLAHFIGSNFPALKRVLLPAWVRTRRFAWNFRRKIFPHTPISIPVKPGVAVKLMPTGQIAEMVWGLEFERAERDFVSHYIRPGMTVFNIGANVGLYTLMASRLTGITGRVYAFEPSSDTFNILLKNIDANKAVNVQATRMALADQKGRLVLKADRHNPTADGHRYVEKLNGEKLLSDLDEVVEADTLDAFVESSGPYLTNRPDLLIIDVEGAELGVLQGAVKTLASSKNVAIMLECTKNQLEVKALLERQGFSFYMWNQQSKALDPCDFLQACLKGDVVAVRTVLQGAIQ